LSRSPIPNLFFFLLACEIFSHDSEVALLEVLSRSSLIGHPDFFLAPPVDLRPTMRPACLTMAATSIHSFTPSPFFVFIRKFNLPSVPTVPGHPLGLWEASVRNPSGGVSRKIRTTFCTPDSKVHKAYPLGELQWPGTFPRVSENKEQPTGASDTYPDRFGFCRPSFLDRPPLPEFFSW